MKFTFKDYDKYTGKVFEIDHYHPSDPNKQKVWLKCVNDTNIIINHYVNIDDLTIVA